ncbi:MAG: GNAT family N-acetyltransferase [Eubacteriales bacterium]|nr:GNAT family N-acetyltransferase [Eubacteriales bacterium]
MRIRRANREDLESIVSLWKVMMRFHMDLDSVYNMKTNAEELFRDYALANIMDQDKRVFVCCAEDEVIGYVFAMIDDLPPVYLDSKIGEVYSMCVAEKFRGKGAGRKLLSECEAWFIDNGINRAECVVSIKNLLSQAFWEGNGYMSYNKRCFKRL